MLPKSPFESKNRAKLWSWFIIFTVSVLFWSSRFSTAQNTNDPVSVMVFSKSTQSHLITALGIEKNQISVDCISNNTAKEYSLNEFETLLHQSDVIFIDRYLPTEISYLTLIAQYVNGSKGTKGLVVFGASIENGIPDFNSDQINCLSSLLPVYFGTSYNVSTNNSIDSSFKVQTKYSDQINAEDFYLTRDIPWESMPAISRRTITPLNTLKADAYSSLLSVDGQEILISEKNLTAEAKSFFCGIIIQGENLPFTLWPYFNYLIYSITLHVAPNTEDSDISRYYEWDHAPIPHLPQIIGWFAMVTSLWVISFLIYFQMKKVTRRDPHYFPSSVENSPSLPKPPNSNEEVPKNE